MAKSTAAEEAAPEPAVPLPAAGSPRLTPRCSRWSRSPGRANRPVRQSAATASEPASLAALIEASPGPLPEPTRRASSRKIDAAAARWSARRGSPFCGPPYSYSHLAAIHRFGKSVQFVPVGTIAAVFEEVHCGHADFGLAPVENSTDGRIADTLEMFTRLPVRICGQVEMAIHHSLLAKCPRAEVKEVYSKPQVISQCRNWLAKHLPSARAIEVASTSTAAQLAAEKPGAAAIASPQAGVEYGLNVLAENIEDNPGNTTRFAVIGGQLPERTGNDRTAMLFQIEHRPGTLADAMNIFKRNKLNLTWIESFPVPGSRRGTTCSSWRWRDTRRTGVAAGGGRAGAQGVAAGDTRLIPGNRTVE